MVRGNLLGKIGKEISKVESKRQGKQAKFYLTAN